MIKHIFNTTCLILLFILLIVLIIMSLKETVKEYRHFKLKKETKRKEEILRCSGYFVKLTNENCFYLTENQYLELQEEINLNNKSYTFCSIWSDFVEDKKEYNEVITIFLNQISCITKIRKTEN